MAKATASAACSRHRRRDAVASCAVCNSPICSHCVVATRVGLKCASCSGERPQPAADRRRRRGAVAAGLGLLAVVVSAYALLRDDDPSSPPVDEDPVATGAPVERVVQLSGAGRVRIAGTLRLPERTGQGPVPGVLVIPGFGPTNRNGIDRAGGPPDDLYRDVSEELADAGMASFRYDKRGTGQSVLPPGEELSFDDMAADARAGIDFLAERIEVDGDALAVVGHDEGALLAMRVAASDPRVESLVLISPPGRPLVDVIADDFRATHGQPAADELREIVDGLLVTGTLPPSDALPAAHRDFFPRDHVPYLREIFSIDPAAYAREVDVPVLIVLGGRATFSTAADAERLVGALGRDAEVVVAPDAGPTLAGLPAATSAGGHGGSGGSDHEGTGTTGRERDVAVLERMSSWLQARLAVAGGG